MGRIYPLGFGSTLIPAKGMINIAVDLKTIFVPEWLVVPSMIGEFFLIEDILINGENILTSPTAGGAFSEFVKEKVKLKTKRAKPMQHGGKEISINVTNLSDKDHNFTACLFGTSQLDSPQVVERS